MNLQEAIKSRKSTKRFTGKKVNLKKVIRCLDNLRFSPCAGNMFNMKFVIVQDEKKIDKIAYIRFASVFRRFVDLEDFEAELKKLL